MRNERPIFSSSSTIRMRLDAMSSHGQQHAETSAAQFSFHHNNVSAIEQGAFARDGKSQPHSPFLEGDGRLKQAGARLFAQPRSGIVDLDRDAAAVRPGGFASVPQKVGQDPLRQSWSATTGGALSARRQS